MNLNARSRAYAEKTTPLPLKTKQNPSKDTLHWKDGQRPTADERLFRVADTLGVDLIELLFGKN